MLVLAGWTAAVAVFAWLDGTDLGTTVVLLALGPILAGLVQSQRQHRTLLRRLDARTSRLDQLAESGVRDISSSVARLRGLTEGLVSAPELAKALDATAADVITRTRKGVAVDLLLTYRQLEALQNLYAVAGVDRPMPATRGWASSPDLLLVLSELVEREKPSLIVECGSGTSTLWLAMVLRRFEIKGRVVALEHQDAYAEKARRLLDQHGLADFAEIRYAPLEPAEVGGHSYLWYAREVWADLDGIDLLFVDGPPTTVGEHARLPALPMLAAQLHPDAVVVLDDLIRSDEQEVVEEWLRTCPDFDSSLIRLEKNAAVLRRRSVHDAPPDA